MRGRVALLGAVFGALATLTPAFASPAPTLYRQTYLLTRTTSLSMSTDFTLGGSWGGSLNNSIQAFVGIVATRVQGGTVTGTGSFFDTLGAEDSVLVSTDSHSVRPCDDYGACQTEQSTFAAVFGDSYQDSGGADVANRMYVVFEGTQRATVTFSAHGWALRQVPFTYRWLDSDQTDATQGRALGDGAEVFTDAQLRGGKYGSLATVTPPCSTQTEPTVPQGAGQLTLSAPGATDATATCPTSPWNAVSVIRHATTWTVHGEAAGVDGSNTARIFVIDLPKRL